MISRRCTSRWTIRVAYVAEWPKKVGGATWLLYFDPEAGTFWSEPYAPDGECLAHLSYAQIVERCKAGPVSDESLRETLIAAFERRSSESSEAEVIMSRRLASLLITSDRRLAPAVAATMRCDPSWTYGMLARDWFSRHAAVAPLLAVVSL